MNPRSLKVTGSQESLHDLRRALLAEPEAAECTVTELARDTDPATSEPVRVREDIGMGMVLFHFAVHLPAGIAAHAAYDWVHNWLIKRADAAQVRVKEVPPPEDTQTTTGDGESTGK